MNGDLKTTFVRLALMKYMQRTINAMRVDMMRRNIRETGESEQSFSSRATEDSGSLIFRQYLRFVDMGVGRGHPLGGLVKTRMALQAQKKSGDVLVKDTARKPKKIYSKNAYGNLSYLQGLILFGYSEETMAMLKKELEGKP